MKSIWTWIPYPEAPNAFIRGKCELVAIRDINEGKEITFDYSTTMNDNEVKVADHGVENWVGKCNCRSEKCRKLIDQIKTLPHEVKKYYLINKLLPDFILKAKIVCI